MRKKIYLESIHLIKDLYREKDLLGVNNKKTNQLKGGKLFEQTLHYRRSKNRK